MWRASGPEQGAGLMAAGGKAEVFRGAVPTQKTAIGG